jgi:hypothetical protein
MRVAVGGGETHRQGNPPPRTPACTPPPWLVATHACHVAPPPLAAHTQQRSCTLGKRCTMVSWMHAACAASCTSASLAPMRP